MLRLLVFAMILALPLAPHSARAQSAPLTGPTSGAVHGQTWDMRQDLSSPTNTDGLPLTRTERLRRQAAEAEARRRAQQRNPPR